MKTIIRIEDFDAVSERVLARAEKIDRGERIEPERSISFESIEDMLECLSPQRVRLCEVARTNEYTVTSLAAALERDPKAVRRDIQKLMKFGFIRTREQINPGHGKVKIVEPVAKSFDLRASF